MDRITYRSVMECITIEVSEDKRYLAVFREEKQIAVFVIEDVWDMIRDSLAIVDTSPTSDPGLYRRKKEAITAIREMKIANEGENNERR